MFTVGKNGINIRDVVGPVVVFILGMNLQLRETFTPDISGVLGYIHSPPVLKVENQFISEIKVQQF